MAQIEAICTSQGNAELQLCRFSSQGMWLVPMRLLAFLLTLLILAGGAWLYLGGKRIYTHDLFPTNAPAPSVVSTTLPSISANSDSNRNLVSVQTPQLVQTPSVETSLLPATPIDPSLAFSASSPVDVTPEAILGNMRNAILLYTSMFGGNPVGTNPQITRALNGENPKGVRFLKPEAGLRVNGQGELVDGWGTPFFFHQLSGTDMEIRSAGPDRKMWTSDDLVTK